MQPTWRTFRDYFARLGKQGIGINLASYVGATDLATFDQPNRLSEGMRFVLVNGVPVIEEGKMTNALPGKVLTR